MRAPKTRIAASLNSSVTSSPNSEKDRSTSSATVATVMPAVNAARNRLACVTSASPRTIRPIDSPPSEAYSGVDEVYRLRSSSTATRGTATPSTTPSPSSVSSSPASTSSRDSTDSSTSTTGRASPSLSPLSTLSSERSRAGTSGRPTIADAKTGSVGARTAPTSIASVHGSPATACASTAVMPNVSGMPSTSARPGSRQARRRSAKPTRMPSV